MPRSRIAARLLAAVLALAVLPAAARATEAAATTALNVRSGPGTSYAVVDTLTAGEVVEMSECQPSGWCYITHSGPDGWVNSAYLTAAPGAGPPGPDCRFELSLGPDGPRFSLVCGDGPAPGPAPGPGPAPAGDQACFYDGTNYTGAGFCRGPIVINALPPAADERMSSIRLSGAARAQLCVEPNLGGFCRVVTTSEPALGPLLNDRVSSLRVFTGALPPPPPVTPVTHSTGPVNLPLGGRANLDTGTLGGPGADIWLRQISPGNRRLVPINGARLARGDGTNRGLNGCRAETFSAAPLPLAALTVGTYVCARTSEGRISQFRVNGFTGPVVMRLGYTTWAN